MLAWIIKPTSYPENIWMSWKCSFFVYSKSAQRPKSLQSLSAGKSLMSPETTAGKKVVTPVVQKVRYSSLLATSWLHPLIKASSSCMYSVLLVLVDPVPSSFMNLASKLVTAALHAKQSRSRSKLKFNIVVLILDLNSYLAHWSRRSQTSKVSRRMHYSWCWILMK